MMISHQAARNIVERLKKKELIALKVDENDARARKVHLTDKGKTLHDKLMNISSQEGQQILSNLTDEEKELLVKLLKSITKTSNGSCNLDILHIYGFRRWLWSTAIRNDRSIDSLQRIVFIDGRNAVIMRRIISFAPRTSNQQFIKSRISIDFYLIIRYNIKTCKFLKYRRNYFVSQG